MSDKYVYVNDAPLLREMTGEVKQVSRLALDTEADSLHHYYEKVCLIQISLEDRNFILDPLTKLDLSGFLEALRPKALVLHGSDYDLRMLYASFGYRHEGELFDTMLAAQILGYDQLGLAALVKRHFNVDLVKKGQKADWSNRPLKPDLLDYAADDTRYLLKLSDLLEEELVQAGRREWHRQACRNQLRAADEVSTRDPDSQWRIKGSSKFQGLALALLKEIWQWREAEAQNSDRPSFKILANQAMVDLVDWAIEHPRGDLSHGPRLPKDCVGRRYKALQTAIQSAHSLPRAQWPGPPNQNRIAGGRKVDEALVGELREARDKLATELLLDAAILAPKSSLYAIANRMPTTAEEVGRYARFTQWQAELLAPAFLKVLQKHMKRSKNNS